MNEIANQLVQSLFKKNSLQDCSRWELEILAEHYPYFGIAQLLVASKLKEENADGYEKQVQKTSLYFTNPFWLDHVLKNKTLPFRETITDEKVEMNPVPEAILEEINEVETEIVDRENHIAQPEVTEPIVENTDFKEEEIIEETLPASQVSEDANVVPEAILEEINEVETEIIHRENHIEQSEVNEPIVENTDFKEEEIIEEPLPALQHEHLLPEEEKVDEFKIAPLKMEPAPDENTPLAFEPYHTVDYFASQGIKLSQEEKPQDRFGQQLKSFTQWLKTIKKAPSTETANEFGKGIEQKVVTLAEHSIEDRDIVTETMAEVWAKQGNREKAIEVYNKLSLQNPAKSSYFASLIEQLNQH